MYQQNEIDMTITKQPELLKVGSLIEYKNGQMIWEKRSITRVSEKFVWFAGSGVCRVARQTFLNYPELFRIIEI